MVLEFPIKPMRNFQKFLASEANVECDNHTCFLVEMRDTVTYNEKTVAFMFSDFTMYVGDKINEKRW